MGLSYYEQTILPPVNFYELEIKTKLECLPEPNILVARLLYAQIQLFANFLTEKNFQTIEHLDDF